MFHKKPYFIAEISANHNGSLKNAKKLISLAKKNGADAVKLQTYKPDTMTLNFRNKYFRINKGLWKNYYLFMHLSFHYDYSVLIHQFLLLKFLK